MRTAFRLRPLSIERLIPVVVLLLVAALASTWRYAREADRVNAAAEAAGARMRSDLLRDPGAGRELLRLEREESALVADPSSAQ